VATSITTQADVLTYGLVTDNEISNLTTDRMEKEAWSTLHARAWTKILDLLALRTPTIEESDLSDTTELTVATVYMVMHYAYAQAEFMSDEMQARSDLYWKRAVAELEEARLTVNGSTAPRDSYAFKRARRM
jgi:hypothetical protein